MNLSKNNRNFVGKIILKDNLKELLRQITDDDLEMILKECTNHYTNDKDVFFNDIVKRMGEYFSIKQSNQYLYISIDKYKYSIQSVGKNLLNYLVTEQMSFDSSFNYEEMFFKIEYRYLTINEEDKELLKGLLKIVYLGIYE